MNPDFPDNLRLGGGDGSSLLHPVALVAMLITAILIFVLPRKYVIVPLLFFTFLTPSYQQIYFIGLHLFLGRIVILCGWTRMLWTKMVKIKDGIPGGLNEIDKLFVVWALIRAVATVLQFEQGQAIINQAGFLWDVVGGYFLIRFLIRDIDDIGLVVKTFAVTVMILGTAMTVEKVHDLNVFGYLGGVPIHPISREGAIRAQAAFAHPILAGVFGATLVCPFVWLWWSKRSKFSAAIGIVGSTLIVLASASSTPLMAYVAGIGTLFLWPVRKSMRMIRWGIVIVLVGLDAVMKAPVWFLIARVDLVAGNSGYHRAMLIDNFVRHFSDWWLIGVQGTGSWGFDMWDVSNQFVIEGEYGGLAAFICFVLIVAWGFGRIGRARKAVDGDRAQEWFLWILGATLFTHVVSFFGVTYFDQTKMLWYVMLTMISVVTGPILATAAARKREAIPTFETFRPSEAVTRVPSTATRLSLPGAKQIKSLS